MAENLEIIASVKIDFSKFKNDIEGAKQYLGTLQAEYAKVVDVFGEGSKEAKEAGEAVRQMTEYLKGAGAAGEGIDQPVKSLKAQLKEANAELQLAVDKFGLGSKEAAEAAAKVANLKDTIGDAKTLTDAFNPDAKFKGLANAVQGAVGAFTALQGAQALFGNQSKEVQETLVKLQGALALSQGVNSVLEAKDSFIALGNQIKSASIFQQGFNLATRAATAIQTAFGVAVNTTSTSFKTLRGAIAATGIGALVIALGFVVEKLMAFTDSTEDQEKAQKKLNAELKEYDRLLNKEIKDIEFVTNLRIANSKKAGASEAELNKIREEGADKVSNKLRAAEQKAFDEYTAIQVKKGATDEQIAEARDRYLQAQAKREDLSAQQDLKRAEKAADDAEKVREKDADNAQKAAEKAKAAREKANQEEKQRQEQRAAFLQSTEKLIEDNRLAALEDGIFKQQALAERAFQQELDKLIELKDKKVINEKDYQKNRAELEKQLALNIKKILDDNAKKDAEDRKKAADEIAKLEFDAKLRGITDNEEKLTVQRQAAFDKEKQDLDNQLKNKDLTQDEYNNLLKLKQQNLEADLTKIKTDGAVSRINQEIAEIEERLKSGDLSFKQQEEALRKEAELKIQALNAQRDAEILAAEQAGQDTDAIKEKYKAKTLKINGELAKSEKDLSKAKIQATLQAADATAATLEKLSALFGKESRAGKALAVASTTISTFTSAQKAYESTVGIPVVGPVLAPINAGLAIAAGIKNIQEILKVKTPGGDGGGSGSVPSITAAAPLTAQQTTTALPQDQINQLASANATVRAYVVESDVSGNQERITRLNRAARIS